MKCLWKMALVGNGAVWVGIAFVYWAVSSPLGAEAPRPRLTLRGHTDEVRCVAISPDGKVLASGGADNTIRFWDLATGKEQATLKKAAIHWVDSVAYSPDGKVLASGAGGNTIKLWDVGTRKARALLEKDRQFASPKVVFSKDGKSLASGGQCIQEIIVWDVTTGKQMAMLKGHSIYGTKAMAFERTSKALLSVGDDAQVKVWEVATGKNTDTLATADHALAAAFSPDSKAVATAVCVVERINERNVITDNSVKVWDVATGKKQITLPAENVWCLAFNPDGKVLATGSEEGKVQLWDVATGKELATLKGHTAKVLCLAFSADGKMLASASADKTIKLWDVARPR
jgi:WD40 repeat protein